MQKVTPFLTFESEAEPAAKFYLSVFKKAKITDITYYGSSAPELEGSVMTVSFRIGEQDFVALNGPRFKPSGIVSLCVTCATQKEVDAIWAKLSRGGRSMQCGWITDKFGITWQIVPAGFTELVTLRDPVKAKRAFEAMIEMEKLDLHKLRKAVRGK